MSLHYFHRRQSDLVVQVDDDSVAFRNVQEWKRPLAVDSHDRALGHAIWVCVHPANVPVEGDGIRDDSGYETAREEGEQRHQEVGQRKSHCYR